MRIKMYNCNFGDCFKIESENANHNPLYVDFGIHARSLGKEGREERYENIINDMPIHKDFLLTHYHEDHYDGILYMSKFDQKLGLKFGQKFDRKFDNIYIPDIWNINCSIEVVNLILLRGLLTKSILRKGLTLFDFLISICKMEGTIFFIKSGKKIQEQYTVLWPDEHKINIPPDIEEIARWGITRQIAEDLVNLMRRNGEDGTIVNAREEMIRELIELRRRYLGLDERVPANRGKQYKLTKWGNEISIVFHSKDALTRRILFCGDVVQNAWDSIIKNIKNDRDCLYSVYDVIKVPHHGTKAYYHDFSNVSDENTIYLIPNGNNQGWPICKEYSDDINEKSMMVICSNNNACAARFAYGRCKCRKRKIISEGDGWYWNV